MVRVLETALRQTADQRNLTTFKIRTIGVTGTGTRTLVTTAGRAAVTGTVTTADALARLARNGVVKIVKFHRLYPQFLLLPLQSVTVAFRKHLAACAQLRDRRKRRFHDIHRVLGTEGLREDVLHAAKLQHMTHAAAGDNAGTG